MAQPNTATLAVASPSSSERTHLLVAVVGLLAVWLGFRLFTGVVFEDALITYRHSANLAQGHGLVFNPGEAVLGSTTPLVALWLGLFGMVFGVGAIPWVSVLTMLSAGVASAVALYLCLRTASISHRAALLAMLAAGLQANVVVTTVGGMETPLVAAWMMLTLLASLRERPVLLGVGCALLVLTRPDGLVWCALVGLRTLWVSRRTGLIAAGLAAGILAVWVGAATVYYGSPLPHSMVAKGIIASERASLASPAHLFGFVFWLLEHLGLSKGTGLTGHFAAGMWFALLLFGVARLWSGPGRTVWPLVALPPALAIAYYVGRAPRFDWYLVPFTYCLMVIGALGAASLGDILWRRTEDPRSDRSVRAAAGVAALLLVLDFGNALRHEASHQRAHQINEDGTRRVVGEWLDEHGAPDATVAMEAIGYQGSYSKRHIIDLAGLVSPSVVNIHRSSNGNAEVFARVLSELKPDYLVLRSYEVTENRHYHGGPLFAEAAQRAYFDAHYRVAVVVEAPDRELWGERGSLTVYQRAQ